jgi:hypothetical protein
VADTFENVTSLLGAALRQPKSLKKSKTGNNSRNKTYNAGI